MSPSEFLVDTSEPVTQRKLFDRRTSNACANFCVAALSTNSPVKRKASEVLDVDDFENVDPALFSKRSKGAGLDGSHLAKDQFKPSGFVLTKATSTPSLPKHLSTASKPAVTSTASRPRTFLQPKSPAARLNTSISKSAPLSAPAGRSPTRGPKRIGILSSRRRGGQFGRVDPPAFGLGTAAPFSLDAALKGTIPSYSGRSSAPGPSDLASSLGGPEMKSDWFFDIHEDTPEQEMTNLLQHGTCTLDISSDEESEVKARRERAEGRDKENIPPADDVSQTRAASARQAAAAAAAGAVDEDQMAIEKMRGPLVEMNPADYYPEGCDDSSVIVVAGDEEADADTATLAEKVPSVETSSLHAPAAHDFTFSSEAKVDLDMPVQTEIEPECLSVDALMGKEDPAAKAAVLEPMEGTGDSFELWESGSSKDETEATDRNSTTAPDTCSQAEAAV